MNSYPLEPGVLSTFKSLTVLRLVLLILSAVAQILLTGWPATAPLLLLLSLGDVLLLLGFLSWDKLIVRLKSAYLPIAILVASAGPILEQHISVRLSAANSEINFLVNAWQLFPLLFIPLFVTAWQYPFRKVVWFCLGTAVLDLALGAVFSRSGNHYLVIRPVSGVIFIRTVAYLLVGYMVVNLMNSQRQLRRALTQTNSRLSQYAVTLEKLATSRERNRLARELHDVVAHSLSGAAVELEAVKVLWDSEPNRAQSMLDQSLKTIRNGLTETRRALQALRATPLEDLGLGLAVRNLAESVTSRAGIALDLQIPDKLGDYPPETEQCVYRVVEEALTNISVHASARHVSVHLLQDERKLCLEIADDGRGFDLQKVDERQTFGLKGMRERAEMAGGQFVVQSQEGVGTTIRLVLEKRDDPGINL